MEEQRVTFRYGTNRRTEIALKKELDDLTRKSITEMAVTKEAELQEPLTGKEAITRFVKYL